MITSSTTSIKLYWRIVIASSIILFSIIILKDVVRETLLVRDELHDIRLALREEAKTDLLSDMETILSEVNEIIDDREMYQEEQLKEELAILQTTLEQTVYLMDTEPELTIRSELIQVVQDFEYNPNENTYYLINDEGRMFYCTCNDQISDIDITDYKDYLNNEYILNIINSTENYTKFNIYLEMDFHVTEIMVAAQKIENSDYIIITMGNSTEFLNNQFNQYFTSISDHFEKGITTLYIFNESEEVLYSSVELINNALVENLGNSEYNELKSLYGQYKHGYSNLSFIENDKMHLKNIGYFTHLEDVQYTVYLTKDTSSLNKVLDRYVENNVSNIINILIPIYLAIFALVILVIRVIRRNKVVSDRTIKEEEDLYKILANTSDDFIIITDKTGDIQYVNDIARAALIDDEGDDNDAIEILNLDKIIMEEEGYNILIGIHTNFFIKSHVQAIHFNAKECDLYIIDNVTEKVVKERELEALTLQDELTKMGNRRQLIRDYSEYVVPHIKQGEKAYLAMIDLDNFKEANDTFGHGFGDEVLEIISDIFMNEATDDIKMYRVGGDEFALLAINTSSNHLLSILRKMRNKVTNHKYRNKIEVSFSSGVVEIDIKNSKRRFSDYYEQADELLYKAKADGKGTVKM